SADRPDLHSSLHDALPISRLDDNAISGLRVVYRQTPKLRGGAHFGSRIAFDREGHVFISQGERNDRSRAQDLSMLQGKLVRLDRSEEHTSELQSRENLVCR